MRSILLAIFISILLTCSCTTTKFVEVPVETIKTEYIHDTKTDSVYVRDSIDRWREGDTVFIYKEHTKYKYLNKTDTIVRIDSIPKIIKVETKEVVEVNHLKWYQEALMWTGGIAVLLLTGSIIYKIKFK